MSPSTSTSSSSKTPSSSVPSISEPLDESDNEEEYTSYQEELAAQAEKIANFKQLVRELNSNQAEKVSESSSSSTSASKELPDNTNSEQCGTSSTCIETRSVQKKNCLITSASVSKMLFANRIHANTTDSFIRISMIRGALTTAGLKYLLDGNRRKPIPSPTNTFGYTERNIATVDSIDENTGVVVHVCSSGENWKIHDSKL